MSQGYRERTHEGMPVLNAARRGNQAAGWAMSQRERNVVRSSHTSQAQSCKSPIPPCGARPADHST
eukprot:365466-Chlamydomonas_euryale.AAC.5